MGMFLNFLGESSYSYQEIVLKIDLDNVAYSISDLFWYSSYIFCIMGLVILLKEYYKSDFPIGNPINLIICVLLLVILMAFLIYDTAVNGLENKKVLFLKGGDCELKVF